MTIRIMPIDFRKRMQEMLGDEFALYETNLQKEARRGFRVNTLKIREDDFFAMLDFPQEKSPFAVNGYYLDDRHGIGSGLPFHAGLIYMQEPSASAAVTVLHPEKGMKVLDLCAAPGSKSTQIAEYLDNTGLLVVNEYQQRRASVLKENIVRHGCANTIVLNSDTKDIAEAFPGYFDQVLCDAPCSGEGMFRKEPEALAQWSIGLVRSCAERQKEILHNAWKCVRAGGTLVYSTCTLNKEENEMLIDAFLRETDNAEIIRIETDFGRPAFACGSGTEGCRRIFPMDGGEGHFICHLRKTGEETSEENLKLLKGEAVPKETEAFLKEQFDRSYPYLFAYKGKVYGGVYPFISCGRCRLIRHQVYLGEMKNGRFEPDHAAYMSAYTGALHSVEVNDEDGIRYLRGETLNYSCPKGYVSVQWHGYPIGFGRSDGSIIKNKYPKEYRIR